MKAKLKLKFGDTASRTGGKGTQRRKKKSVRKGPTVEDKKLQAVLKRLNVQVLQQIAEVNIFNDDGSIIHFEGNFLTQAAVQAHTFVVSGRAQHKSIAEMLPGILSQCGPANFAHLQDMVGQYQAAAAAAGGDDSDDDVPDLVENFETAADN